MKMQGSSPGASMEDVSRDESRTVSEECFQCLIYVPENERLSCNLCSRICHLGCLSLCPAPLEGDK